MKSYLLYHFTLLLLALNLAFVHALPIPQQQTQQPASTPTADATANGAGASVNAPSSSNQAIEYLVQQIADTITDVIYTTRQKIPVFGTREQLKVYVNQVAATVSGRISANDNLRGTLRTVIGAAPVQPPSGSISEKEIILPSPPPPNS
ncbi:hypothetical protein THASP1DRAFT_30986 [Thamnocephalis sphaerospora]|uniref:Uncharacterized protein n=1 Tax=Thamnocephalis sphaerospora TaxID=78915 RepID=A0A4P9XMM9_9FUNG|nr:hypothetical protein THASP1DRAFT_30986 [Thamnocephalis sphaerospora]|eukprot:RKP07197.1 hypothetical protein THASP1DRAFT_30986 [Thamnocephalis sphaerospora]